MSDDLSIPTRPSYRVPLQPRRGHDPARRMRLLIAGGLAAVVVAWFAGSAMLHGGGGGVPTVQAQSGPMRVKPANPGGLQVAGADNAIFSGNGGNGEDKLAPPPQTPDLQALRAPPPAPKPAEHRDLAVATPPPPPPMAQRAVEAPKPPAVAAASKPMPADDGHKPVVAADYRPAPPVARGAHGTLVQLAALSTEQAARQEWDLLAKRMPQLLAGKQPAVSKIEHDGHTYWRLRTGGFSDTAQATMFCMRLRAKGASCSVADF